MDKREMIININYSDEEFVYLTGHVINEKILFPATGYLVFLWERIAWLSKQECSEVPVVFEDINFIRATVLSHKDVELTISIQEGIVIT